MNLHLFGTIALACCVAVGCSEGPSATDAELPDSTVSTGADHHEHGDGHDEDHAQNDMDLMHENLAQLSDADRASAEQQHMCPVSGEMLGTMGVPEKVTVNGQDVWICCPSCREPLENDPEKYLSELNSEN